jgi:hypothetical protein
MANLVKDKNKALTSEKLSQLQVFIEKIKSGEIAPFKEKTVRAKRNLKKAGILK